jgi:uncharacterized protein
MRRFAGTVGQLCAALLLSAGASSIGAADTPHAGDSLDRNSIMIPMKDGVRLFACLTLPRDARADARIPALLTMDPYAVDRCVDNGRSQFLGLARAGYAVAYVHVRGTGLSEGVLPAREYAERELSDAKEVIDWLARQPWSTGKVGMFGASWSGFNALQVAMQNPPALKAIVAAVATEDMYHEDARYQDGIMRFDDWDAFADLQLIAIPAPNDPFDEATLQKRFDQSPWSLMYLQHQRDGEFWRRGIRLDQPAGRLTVPTLMIGGWYDGYRPAILRALEHASGPVRAVVGPWEHERNQPAPSANELAIALQWWDYWLKDSKNGAREAPQVIAYMRRPYRPQVGIGAIPGEWRAVQRWSDRQERSLTLYLAAGHTLQEKLGPKTSEQLRYIATGGAEAGIWWGDPMPDQRPADAYSLTYESQPLQQELDLLGSPEVRLSVSSSATRANWMVRLEDVAPDGSVTQITGKAINGTHRDSDESPQSLTPGQVYRLDIPLLFTSWIYEPGHRIRIAVSNALFPMYWPTPEPMTSSLELGGEAASTLTLPVIPPAPPETAEAAAALVGSRNLSRQEAEAAPAEVDLHWIGPAHIDRDVPKASTIVRYGYGYHGEFNVSTAPGDTMLLEYQASDNDPAHVRITARVITERTWQGHKVRWQGKTEITSDRTQFHYVHERQMLRDGAVVREKTWTKDVPRDYQ